MPGKDKTLWDGGLFKLDVLFPDGTITRFQISMKHIDLCSRISHQTPEV